MPKVPKINYLCGGDHSWAQVRWLTLVMTKRNRINSAPGNHQLKTELPFAEKDEQAHCMERMRRLQSEALKLWRSLKKKPK